MTFYAHKTSMKKRMKNNDPIQNNRNFFYCNFCRTDVIKTDYHGRKSSMFHSFFECNELVCDAGDEFQISKVLLGERVLN